MLVICSGLSGGEENGRRGYMMTFVIAYIRVKGMRTSGGIK